MAAFGTSGTSPSADDLIAAARAEGTDEVMAARPLTHISGPYCVRQDAPPATIDDIRAARAASKAESADPLRPSPWLSAVTGGDVRLKLETLQLSFSYKIRGAFNAILRLVEDGGPPPTLVTASAGNHGRALGHAAAEAGLALTVYAPEGAPQVKLDAIRRTGADLRRAAITTTPSDRRRGTRPQATRHIFLRTRISTSSPGRERSDWRYSKSGLRLTTSWYRSAAAD